MLFKPYSVHQPVLLPENLSELIPAGHVVRVVQAFVEGLEMEMFRQHYKGGGRSSYHPKMMLAVLLYAYLEGIYSSRKIAKALRENIYFLWLSGRNQPDFRTVNRFRGELMPKLIEPVFGQLMEVLVEGGYVSLESYYLDGSKIQANARRGSAVWAKNTKRWKSRVQEQVKQILEEVEAVNEAEDEQYEDRDLPEMGEEAELDAERLREKIQELNEKLKKKPEDPRHKAVRKLEQDLLPKLEKYEEQEELLAGRNSYSRTDPDATFMRLKEDQRQPKAWPKPAYNLQLGTENQFILGYSLHNNSSDSGLLIPHLEKLRRQWGRLPTQVVADAGYGFEENYTYLEAQGSQAYLKYPGFDKKKRASQGDQPFGHESFHYEAESDTFTCPDGRTLRLLTTDQRRNRSGFLVQLHRYECEDCQDCSLRAQCTSDHHNRSLAVSWPGRRLKEQARELLHTVLGQKLRSERGTEVEAVFGQVKHNRKFRRFHLRGMTKVTTEMGLVALAHNLLKMTTA